MEQDKGLGGDCADAPGVEAEPGAAPSLCTLAKPQLSYSSKVGVMNIISCSLRDELSVDFSRARAQLAEARLRQDKKDTSANRAAVAECWTRMDAVLDMHLLDTNFQEGK